MTQKQWIHVELEMEDYLKGKSLGTRWSPIGRKLFKQYFSATETDNDELKLVEELKKANEKKTELDDKIMSMNTQLLLIIENKEKEYQEKLDVEMRINQGRKESGINPLNR